MLTDFLKKKEFMYSASELKFTHTVHWFFKKNTVHFSEQCGCGGMLHCSLNIAAWCTRKKQAGPAFIFHAFQMHNLVDP